MSIILPLTAGASRRRRRGLVSAPPVVPIWAGEPADSVLIAQWLNESELAPDPWNYEGPNPGSGGFHERIEVGVPFTPNVGGPAVLHYHTDEGAPGGYGMGRIFVVLDNLRRVYTGMNRFYPAAYPASNNSNKIAFWNFGSTQVQLGFLLGNGALPENGKLCLTLESGFGAFAQKLIGSIDVSLGTQQMIEVRMDADAGTVEMDVDGEEAIRASGITFPTGDFTTFYHENTNNGTRYPTGSDPRIIAPGPADGYMSAMRVSEPPAA